MDKSLRPWKCRNCGRANSTEVSLDGTAKCEHCSDRMLIQPSRLRGGAVLPRTFPFRSNQSATGDR